MSQKVFTNGAWKQLVQGVPYATEDKAGVVKVGANLSVTEDGTLSAIEQDVPVASDALPQATGEASAGTSPDFSRADHVHPSKGNTGGVPVGTIVYFCNSTVPDGYLVCNGGSYSSTTYADLYAVIGTTFGGTTSSFKVPNLIDKVAWGNATVGTVKNAGLPNITGALTGYNTNSGEFQPFRTATGAFSLGNGTSRSVSAPGAGAGGAGTNFNAANSNSIYGASTTVQPPALTLLPCIKY